MRGLEAQFGSGHALPEVISLEIYVGNIDHGVNGENIDADSWGLFAQKVGCGEERDGRRKSV